MTAYLQVMQPVLLRPPPFRLNTFLVALSLSQGLLLVLDSILYARLIALGRILEYMKEVRRVDE